MVDHGAIIAEGTHEELSESSEPYRELVEVWHRGLA
jgi:ABC-type multidrug transport system fused ATPase/permease subunit